MKKNIRVSEKVSTLLILFCLLNISNIFHLNTFSLPKVTNNNSIPENFFLQIHHEYILLNIHLYFWTIIPWELF